MMKPFICFIHIEKCAGTSLHHMLHHGYPGYYSLSPELREGQNFSPGQLNRLRQCVPDLSGIGGHRVRCFLDYEKVLPNRRLFYFTFLRDPIARYLSHVNYQNKVMGEQWTLESFAGMDHYRDFQTLRIAGSRDLDKAKRLLVEKLDFVGLMSDYDPSLLLLKQALGQPDIDFRYRRANVGESSGDSLKFEDLTEEQQQHVRDCNRLDLELYAFAKKELFPNYVAQYKGNLEADTQAFGQSLQTFQYPKSSVLARKGRHLLVNVLLKPMLRGSP